MSHFLNAASNRSINFYYALYGARVAVSLKTTWFDRIKAEVLLPNKIIVAFFPMTPMLFSVYEANHDLLSTFEELMRSLLFFTIYRQTPKVRNR